MAEALTPEQIIVLAEQVAKILSTQSQGVGEVTKVTSLDGVYSLPALLFTGTDEAVVEAPLSLLRVWLQRSPDAIQWKQGDTGEWQNLITIPDLTGPKGETPEFRTGSNGIEWKYTNEEDTAWRPLVSIDQLKLTFDMLTTSQKEAIRGYSAFQLWQQEEGNAGKTYEDYKAWQKKEALEAAQIALKAADQTNQVKQNTEQVKKETEEVQERTDQTRINTLTAKLDTEDVLKETRKVKENTEQAQIETLSVKETTGQTEKETRQIQERTDQTRINTLTAKLDTEDVLKETRKVKENTEQTRMGTLSVKETTGQTEKETKRIQERTDQTRIETLKVKQATEEVCDNTKKVAEKTEHLYIRTKSIADETEQVKRNTEAIAAITQELNDHPMIVQGGMWFEWSLVDKEYKNTNIQAQGPVGTSFKIIGRYDTYEDLVAAVPDGSGVDGVYAVGAVEPFSYFAWIAVNGVWKWDDQGKLRGAEGKSAFEVWLEDPANAGKTIIEFYKFLSPYIGDNKNWWVRDIDTGIKAPGTDAFSPSIDPKTKNWLVFDDKLQKYVDSGVLAEGFSPQFEVVKNTPTEYVIKFTTTNGEEVSPNLQGRSGSAVLDIDHMPGEDDTSFIFEGIAYNHSIGDRRRYYNPKKKKYEMYTLMDINSEGKATWEIAGSGDADGIVFLSSPAHLNKSYITIKNGGLE